MLCGGTKGVIVTLTASSSRQRCAEKPCLIAASAPGSSSATCRGAWARVTADQFRHPALQTFKKHRARSDVCSDGRRTTSSGRHSCARRCSRTSLRPRCSAAPCFITRSDQQSSRGQGSGSPEQCGVSLVGYVEAAWWC